MASTKKTGAATERLRMEVELADNGLILRNPDCEDKARTFYEVKADRHD